MTNTKLVTAKASNMLCLYANEQILQPYSLQPTVQIVIPFCEYVILLESMCNAGVLLFNGVVSIKDYKAALSKLYSGNSNPMMVYYTFDGITAGTMELKKAISRGRDATILTLEYEEAKYRSFYTMYSKLTSKFESSYEFHKSFKRIAGDINKLYDLVPIDISNLSVHNMNYYSYLVLLRAMMYEIKEKGMQPFNIIT